MGVNRVSRVVFALHLATLFLISHGLMPESTESTEDSHNMNNFTFEEVFELTTKSFTDKNDSGGSRTEFKDLFDDNLFSFTPPIVNRYGLNSAECVWRTNCDENIELLGRTCQCDTLCPIFDDCCENSANSTLSSSGNFPNMHQFDCDLLTLRSNKIVRSNVVTKCASSWNDTLFKDLCENETDDPNVALQVPVSDDNDIIYRNMYCAYCNFQFDFEFWTAEERCIRENYKPSCKMFYGPPRNDSIKSCRKFDYVSSCFLSQLQLPNGTEISNRCEESPTNFVYTFTSTANGYEFTKYKNRYCALCNGADEELLLCHTGNQDTIDSGDFNPPSYSFRILVDLNALENENMIKSCKKDQMYDPLSKTCRRLFCPKSTISFKGRCIPEERMLKNENLNITSCAFIKLKSNEWQFENESAIYVLALDKMYNSSTFYFNGTDLYICANIFKNQFVSMELLSFDYGESYLSLCGLIFSILALTITLIIYCTFQELLNIPGKVLTCLITCLILAQITFLLTSRAANHHVTCKSLAVIVHYFFTASFTWMNMIAADLLMTFSRSFHVTRSNKESKRFYLYSIYGWLVPLIIVAIAVGVDESNVNSLIDFKPGYGHGLCWITSKNALMLFFVGPLAFFKLIDVVGFTLTSCFIARARHQGSKANKTTKLCSFFLYLKLSAVMGLTWIFAFLAMFTNNTVTWYMFIVFNTLQGVFIAASFLCTRKVFNLVRNRILKKRRESSNTNTTIITLRK